jgi:DNA-binding NtrC family response regulator
MTMKRRNHIVVIDADENRRGILAYTLEIHRYAVHQCGTIREADALLLDEMDLVLAYMPLPFGQLRKLWRSTQTPFMAVVIGANIAPDHVPRIISPTMEDLLNQIKTLTARKRGPRKKS